jgi:fumarate reductase (CoM/CoB) subunit A
MAGRGTPHGGAYLDLSHNPAELIEEKAGTPLLWLLKYGIDIRKQPVEVADAIQHFNGGVYINERAETRVPGLFAAGEAAGGQHGADRPGGNALADCQVFGYRSGMQAAGWAKDKDFTSIVEDDVQTELSHLGRLRDGEAGVNPRDLHQRLQNLMTASASVVRRQETLEKALGDVRSWREELAELKASTAAELCRALELENMFTVSEMVLRATAARQESRGPHYRADFPKRDDANWIKYLVFRRAGGHMEMTTAQPRTE